MISTPIALAIGKSLPEIFSILTSLICEIEVIHVNVLHMVGGYTGKILRINLYDENLSLESPNESFYRKYFGGRALIGYYLVKELRPGVDPLGPENLLIFAPGVLTGAPFAGSGRNSVGAKSPLTGGYGDAEVGGFWGAELKRAGYDAIVVAGKAKDPTYVLIKDDQVRFKDASHIWGKTTGEAEDIIKKENSDRNIRITQIGPAGERQVRYACIINDLSHAAGRCGLGAVMGSKNLRAIAVRGSRDVPVAEPEKVREMSRWLAQNLDKTYHVSGRTTIASRDLGTTAAVPGLNAAGGLPTRNFTQGTFEGAESISGQRMRDTILLERGTCFACPIFCKRVVKVDEPYKVDPRYGGPEYETLASFGSNCGVDDLKAISKANEICAANGLDTISTGVAISFAIECYSRGLLTSKDTGGIELAFGDASAMIAVLNMIVERKGLGRVLGDGPISAAKQIGRNSERYALHVKGQPLPLHEPRLKPGMGIGYAVSVTGADHCHNLHDTQCIQEGPVFIRDFKPLGMLQPIPADDLGPAKIRYLVYHTNWRHFQNCAVICYFTPQTAPKELVEMTNAITGWNVSLWELMKVGEKAANLARAFNAREGFTSKHDGLPDRFFTEPFREGPLKGVILDRMKFERAKTIYYGMMGWDKKTGIPSAEKLHELDLSWVADELGKYEKLP